MIVELRGITILINIWRKRISDRRIAGASHLRSMSLGHSNPNQTPALMQQRARGDLCSRYSERGSQSDGGARVPQGSEAQARTYSALRFQVHHGIS